MAGARSEANDPTVQRSGECFWIPHGIFLALAIWRQPVAKLESGGIPAEIWPQLVAKIPWGNHLLILNKLADQVAKFEVRLPTGLQLSGVARSLMPSRK